MQTPQIVPTIDDLTTIINGVNREIAVLNSKAEWTEEKCKALISTLDYTINVLNAVISLLSNYQKSAKAVMLAYAKSLNNIDVKKQVGTTVVRRTDGKTLYRRIMRYYIHKDCYNLYNDVYSLIGGI